ncbi:MAG: bifunctional folylpolyglutamate synthase/dihydrofolate synthase [Phycisphaerales bacterium]|nr:bifunctional folylpolyglutamate synthase/dihydrofolate synthase [Phycisphaerales bacterium]
MGSRINYERRPMRRHERGTLTLDRMKRLLKDLDNPQNSFRSVHIAGSKGKGSTATMLAQMLMGNDLKVGLYTSPHILDIRERIVINDELITKPALTKLIAKISEVSAQYDDQPTYFEILTAAAFLHFAERQVDVAVIETGLGGRFDATNVLKPEACAITNISIDHTPELGDSLESIAAEKAGVFKSKVPIVSAPQTKEVKKVLKKAADASGSDLHFAGDDIRFSYRFESSRNAGPQARICVTTPTSHFDHLLVPLVGEHQAVNCGVALGLLDQLKNRGFELNDESSINGLANVQLQGRMEMLCDKPRVLGDGAHNAASIEALMRAIGQNVPYDSMVVIFGCFADKDIEGMLKLIRLGADKVIFTRVKSPRTADPEVLASTFANISGRMAQVAPSLADALEIAEKAVTREDLICVTGSFYLVSEAKEHFADHPHRAMSILVQTA